MDETIAGSGETTDTKFEIPGIKPGDAVLVIERRGEQQIVYNGLVVAMSMRESLAGTSGEMALELTFVTPGNNCDPVQRFADVVHISHMDWIEGRAGLAYEELPYPRSGICVFCHCTEARGCEEGCSWANLSMTVCTAAACMEKYQLLIQQRMSGANG